MQGLCLLYRIFLSLHVLFLVDNVGFLCIYFKNSSCLRGVAFLGLSTGSFHHKWVQNLKNLVLTLDYSEGDTDELFSWANTLHTIC
jgi:hypothetical protein